MLNGMGYISQPVRKDDQLIIEQTVSMLKAQEGSSLDGTTYVLADHLQRY